ncbi:MAG: hypothetical protein Kow0031_15140 [Anaerolineae bacterium]
MDVPNPVKTRFFGRTAILEDLVHGVLAPSQPLDYSLVGPKMIGKSRMLKYLADDDGPLKGDKFRHLRPPVYQDGQQVQVFLFDCIWPEARAHLTRFLSDQLQQQLRANAGYIRDWSHIERATSPGLQIGLMVEQLEREHIRMVLLLDHFDFVMRSDTITPDTINELRPLTNMLGLIVATEQPLHDISPALAASPLFNLMHQHFVGLLEPAAATEWLNAYRDRLAMSADLQDSLRRLTGDHPYLLARVNDVITELGPFMAGQPEVGSQHLPLIELRLAEHSRPLFDNTCRRLTESPAKQVALPLMSRLAQGPLPIEALTPDQAVGFNWLVNQAVVRLSQNQVAIFSPLFTRYFLEHSRARPPAAAPSPEPAPALLNSLAPKEARLLRYFQQHSNQPVSFDELLANIWGQPDASSRRVQEAVRRLRLQLKKQKPPLGVIKSERGVGYRFVPHNINE